MASNQIEIDRAQTLQVLEDKLAKWEAEESVYLKHQEEWEEARKQHEIDAKEWDAKARDYIIKNGYSENDVDRGYHRHSDISTTIRCPKREVEEAIGKAPEFDMQPMMRPDCFDTDNDRTKRIDKLRNTVTMLRLSTQTTISGSLAKNAFALL